MPEHDIWLMRLNELSASCVSCASLESSGRDPHAPAPALRISTGISRLTVCIESAMLLTELNFLRPHSGPACLSV